jgi:hypothetical protein
MMGRRMVQMAAAADWAWRMSMDGIMADGYTLSRVIVA